MTNLKQVLEKINIESVLKYLGITESRVNKDELFINCINPNHEDKKPSLSINIGKFKGVWRCWGCDYKGDLVSLVAQKKKITYEQATEVLAKMAGIDGKVSENEILDIALKNKNSLKIVIEKIVKTELLEIDLPRNCISAKGLKCTQEYGISDKFVDKYDIKFCTKGYYENRLIFPIFFSNKLVNFLARATWKVDKNAEYPLNTKALYPKDVSTGRMLFNYDFTNEDTVVLVEGIKDCIRAQEAGFASIACFGNKVTDEQAKLLEKYKKIIILPDRNSDKIKLNNPEKDPGMLLVKTVVSKLLHKIDVCVGFVQDGKDPGDSSIDEIKKAVESSKKYIDFMYKKEIDEAVFSVNRIFKPTLKNN